MVHDSIECSECSEQSINSFRVQGPKWGPLVGSWGKAWWQESRGQNSRKLLVAFLPLNFIDFYTLITGLYFGIFSFLFFSFFSFPSLPSLFLHFLTLWASIKGALASCGACPFWGIFLEILTPLSQFSGVRNFAWQTPDNFGSVTKMDPCFRDSILVENGTHG